MQALLQITFDCAICAGIFNATTTYLDRVFLEPNEMLCLGFRISPALKNLTFATLCVGVMFLHNPTVQLRNSEQQGLLLGIAFLLLISTFGVQITVRSQDLGELMDELMRIADAARRTLNKNGGIQG